MSNNPAILEVVEEYVIPFISYPKESKLPRVIIISKEETKLRDKEIQEMLMKGIISLTKKTEDQLSTLFLVGKKDGGNHPAINLKELNKPIHHAHFKIQGLVNC